jgi:hypothetical protein
MGNGLITRDQDMLIREISDDFLSEHLNSEHLSGS